MSGSVNIAVLGEGAEERASAAQALGKKGSVDDIAFYHTVFQGKIVSAVDSLSYPAKLSSLLTTVNLCDCALVLAEAPSPALGEIIVVLDFLGVPSVFVSQLDLAPFLSPTRLKHSKIFSSLQQAKEFLLAQEPQRDLDAPAKVLVDHCFEVKGVGTVALGIVKQGTLKVHDTLSALPQGTQIEVKSMQKNDDDVKQAFAGDRVGLSIKGTKSEEVPRGTVFSAGGVQVGNEFECQICLSKFAKAPLSSGAFHLSAGLQFGPCVVEHEGGLAPGKTSGGKILAEKPLAFCKGEKMVLCSLNSKGLRAIASILPL